MAFETLDALDLPVANLIFLTFYLFTGTLP